MDSKEYLETLINTVSEHESFTEEFARLRKVKFADLKTLYRATRINVIQRLVT
jgi:hypothetical protein